MEDRRNRTWTDWRVVSSILAAAVLFKVAFILWAGDLVYGDVSIALQFGRKALQDGFSGGAEPLVINSKTLLGPMVWAWIHNHAGVAGLKAFNLACFLGLFGIGVGLGRKAYPPEVLAVALFLFSFYVGTNLNVIAGEQDDMTCAVLFSAGILVYLRKDRTFLASLFMGLAFLFKFTSVVFWLGFAGYLAVRGRGRGLLLTGAGMVVPFLLFNLVSGGSGFDSLWRSLEIQRNFSTWSEVAFKFGSTGMALSVLISAWVIWRGPRGHDVLFFFLSVAYPLYVLILRDAFAAGYVMMICMVFSSFLIARFLLTWTGPARGRKALFAVLLAYLIMTTAITIHNLVHDTQPIVVEARLPTTASPPDSPPVGS